MTEQAKEYVIDNSYDEQYGARPIKRYVTKYIDTMLAEEILNENVKFGQEIIIDVKNDQFYIKKSS